VGSRPLWPLLVAHLFIWNDKYFDQPLPQLAINWESSSAHSYFFLERTPAHRRNTNNRQNKGTVDSAHTLRRQTRTVKSVETLRLAQCPQNPVRRFGTLLLQNGTISGHCYRPEPAKRLTFNTGNAERLLHPVLSQLQRWTDNEPSEEYMRHCKGRVGSHSACLFPHLRSIDLQGGSHSRRIPHRRLPTGQGLVFP
jgi:hypothetical protein